MARPKNTTSKIKVITTKDQQIFNMLGLTGQATKDQLIRLNNISPSRLQAHINTGTITVKGSVKGNIYSLGTKGEQFINGSIYHKAGLEHDLRLTEHYLSLTEEQREHCITGYDYAIKHGLEIQGTPDMVLEYETETETELIEIITPNYKSVDIEQKIQFKQQTNATLKMIYTNKEEVTICN